MVKSWEIGDALSFDMGSIPGVDNCFLAHLGQLPFIYLYTSLGG